MLKQVLLGLLASGVILNSLFFLDLGQEGAPKQRLLVHVLTVVVFCVSFFMVLGVK